jgi:hypothetical protein
LFVESVGRHVERVDIRVALNPVIEQHDATCRAARSAARWLHRCFARSDAGQRREIRIDTVELGVAQIFDCHAFQKRDVRLHVPVDDGIDLRRSEDRLEQTACAGGRHPPEIAFLPVLETDAARGRNRRQQHATRFEDSIALEQHSADVVDDVERLREDYAIVLIGRNVGCMPQVGNDRCARVRLIEIDNVRSAHAIAAETARKVGFLYLQNVTLHV